MFETCYSRTKCFFQLQHQQFMMYRVFIIQKRARFWLKLVNQFTSPNLMYYLSFSLQMRDNRRVPRTRYFTCIYFDQNRITIVLRSDLTRGDAIPQIVIPHTNLLLYKYLMRHRTICQHYSRLCHTSSLVYSGSSHLSTLFYWQNFLECSKFS